MYVCINRDLLQLHQLICIILGNVIGKQIAWDAMNCIQIQVVRSQGEKNFISLKLIFSKSFGFIQGRTYLQQMSDCQLVKWYSTEWN